MTSTLPLALTLFAALHGFSAQTWNELLLGSRHGREGQPVQILGCDELADLHVVYTNFGLFGVSGARRELQQPTWQRAVEAVTGCPNVKVRVEFVRGPLDLNRVGQGTVLVRYGSREWLQADEYAFAGVRKIYLSDGITPKRCVFLKAEMVFFDHVDWRVMASRQLDVLRHEIGHVLGLYHRSDPESIMFHKFKRGQTWTETDLLHSRLAYQQEPCAVSSEKRH